MESLLWEVTEFLKNPRKKVNKYASIGHLQ